MRAAHLAILGGCSLFVAVPAFAQSSTHASNTAGGSPAVTQDNSQSATNARRMLMQDLQKAGFTNINIEPEVFIVHARNSQGQPVLMRSGPDSMEAVTALGTQHQQGGMYARNNATGAGGSTTQQ